MGMVEDVEKGRKAVRNLSKNPKKYDSRDLPAQEMEKVIDESPTAVDNATKNVKEGDSFLHKHFPKYFP